MSTLALKPEEFTDSKDYVSPDIIEENTELLIEILAASDYFEACTRPERSHLISYIFATQRAMFLRFAE